MDQVLVLALACCPRQNEQTDIKKVARSRVRIILEQRKKKDKNLSFFFFLVTAFSGSFSGTTTDMGLANKPLQLLWPSDMLFGHFNDNMPDSLLLNSLFSTLILGSVFSYHILQGI